MESTLYNKKIMLAVFEAFLKNPKMIDTVPFGMFDGGIRDKKTWQIANEYVPYEKFQATDRYLIQWHIAVLVSEFIVDPNTLFVTPPQNRDPACGDIRGGRECLQFEQPTHRLNWRGQELYCQLLEKQKDS